MRSKIRLLIVPSLLYLSSCVLQPAIVRLDSDPNVEHQQKIHDRIEDSNIEAFIQEHPELDEQTQKELREGTISRSDALKRTSRNNSH